MQTAATLLEMITHNDALKQHQLLTFIGECEAVFSLNKMISYDFGQSRYVLKLLNTVHPIPVTDDGQLIQKKICNRCNK